MELAVQKREQFGKANKALRNEGLIPAELYGRGIENLHVAIKVRDFERVFAHVGENTIVNLVLGSDKRSVLVYDVQRDSISGKPVHVDFYQVRMDEKITARIPIEFIGEAPAVKSLGGFLNKGLTEITIEALPGDLPHSFTVNIDGLDTFDKHICVKDLAVPAGVRVIAEPETVIARVVAPVAEKEEVAAAPVDVAQVKVESEEKRAEREAGKTTETKEEA